MKKGVESDTLSSIGRAGHDIGLGAILGGNLFARVAMHPSLAEISDERERGRVLNEAGVDELFVQQVGGRHDEFFAAYARDVIPRLG